MHVRKEWRTRVRESESHVHLVLNKGLVLIPLIQKSCDMVVKKNLKIEQSWFIFKQDKKKNNNKKHIYI